MGMPATTYYSAADLLGMPDDGNKYEVVHGELLVSPSPRMQHQLIVSRLFEEVLAALRSHPVGVCFAGGDFHFGVDSLVIPDLLVVDLATARTGDWTQVTRPMLVVEVLSPSSGRQDRFTKRRLYQEAEVPLYWLVDSDARTVEVWTPDAAFPVTEHQQVRWFPEGATEAVVIQLEELFREV